MEAAKTATTCTLPSPSSSFSMTNMLIGVLCILLLCILMYVLYKWRQRDEMLRANITDLKKQFSIRPQQIYGMLHQVLLSPAGQKLLTHALKSQSQSQPEPQSQPLEPVQEDAEHEPLPAHSEPPSTESVECHEHSSPPQQSSQGPNIGAILSMLGPLFSQMNSSSSPVNATQVEEVAASHDTYMEQPEIDEHHCPQAVLDLCEEEGTQLDTTSKEKSPKAKKAKASKK